MRYVRLTDNRIYDVEHLKIDGPLKDSLSTELFVGYSGKSYGTSQPGVISLNHLCNVNDIMKESDTIEELCDEFVFVDESGKKDLLDDNYKAELQECGTFSVVHTLMKQDRPKELYGAIWTDKGLIYIAKMNEKLELELL